MSRKKNQFSDDDDAEQAEDGEGRHCTICHQEFRGSCPLSNVDCPFLDDLDEDEDAFEDEADDDGADEDEEPEEND